MMKFEVSVMILRGFVASMEPAIANQDMAEVSTIIKMSF